MNDVDYAATDFPGLNFIVEHVGLPRLDDFCWIATQEANVYAGTSVAHGVHQLAAEVFRRDHGEPAVLAGRGPHPVRGATTPSGVPKWIIDKFMSFQLPDDIREEFGVDLTPGRPSGKIMGGNAARLYGIDIEAHSAKLAGDEIATRLAAAA